MPQLKIVLFGAPLIAVNEVPVDLGRRKAIALLAYLAVTDQSHTRDTLATLLWPDYSQINARSALRGVLNSLKAALGDHWLQTNRETVALKLDENSWVDVSEFRRLLTECQKHAHADALTCSQCNERLVKAV
jgi:DNA-binding SARP family transcriptional activator